VSGIVEGKVAVVTGAARGIGRGRRVAAGVDRGQHRHRRVASPPGFSHGAFFLRILIADDG